MKKWEGKNWKAIAEHVPGRNHTQCLQRWRKTLQPGLVKVRYLKMTLFKIEKSNCVGTLDGRRRYKVASLCGQSWSREMATSGIFYYRTNVRTITKKIYKGETYLVIDPNNVVNDGLTI